jgi:hypothetical protein
VFFFWSAVVWWKAIASSIAPSCKHFKAALLFVDDSFIRDIIGSRILDCSLPRAPNRLDSSDRDGPFKHLIAYSTGQSRHYTINFVQPVAYEEKWRNKIARRYQLVVKA